MTQIYTDGACLLNYNGGPCIGICGFWDENNDNFAILDQLQFATSAYEMELRAIQMALSNITENTIIFTDSMQAISCITAKQPKIKTEYEQSLRTLFETKNQTHNIKMEWVKSHGDNVGNNTIDQKLEQQMIKLIQQLPDSQSQEIISIVQERYHRKGCFEKFSLSFFEELIANIF
jgi:ribonuclease HI